MSEQMSNNKGILMDKPNRWASRQRGDGIDQFPFSCNTQKSHYFFSPLFPPLPSPSDRREYTRSAGWSETLHQSNDASKSNETMRLRALVVRKSDDDNDGELNKSKRIETFSTSTWQYYVLLGFFKMSDSVRIALRRSIQLEAREKTIIVLN